jgi:hypothetical protein
MLHDIPTPQRHELVLLATLLGAGAAPAQADYDWRPPLQDLFRTDLVFPQEQGELQLGTFPTWGDGPAGSAFVLPIGVEYGITDSLQIEAEWDAYIHADAEEDEESGSGQGNLQVGFMYSWIDIQDSGFHTAAGFEYEFASGDPEFQEGGFREDAQELFLIFAKDLDVTSRRQLFLQVGVEFRKDRRPATAIGSGDLDLDQEGESESSEGHDPNVWFANLGGYTTWGATVMSLEINLSEDAEERYVTPGITYQPAEGFEIGLGVAVGVDDEADDYQVIGKLIWELGD